MKHVLLYKVSKENPGAVVGAVMLHYQYRSINMNEQIKLFESLAFLMQSFLKESINDPIVSFYHQHISPLNVIYEVVLSPEWNEACLEFNWYLRDGFICRSGNDFPYYQLRLIDDGKSEEPKVIYATVREAISTQEAAGGKESEWHIECRFEDGQKYAAIKVVHEMEALADLVAELLNEKAKALGIYKDPS